VKTIARLVLICAALAVAVPALAHHSAAAYDTHETSEDQRNRRAVPVREPARVSHAAGEKKTNGSVSTVEVEAGAAAVLNGLGFTKDSVKSGDVVTVVGNPARAKPDGFVLGRELYKSDGTYVPLNIASRSVYESKTAVRRPASPARGVSPRTEFGAFSRAARADGCSPTKAAAPPARTSEPRTHSRTASRSARRR
jgi:hypothetical protein